MSEPTPEPALTPEPKQVRDSRSEANSNNPASQSKVVALILAALTLFVFWPVVHFGFINFDDPDSLSQIDTQPAMSPLCFAEKRVIFLILEGKEAKKVAGRLWSILEKHGVKAC